MLGRPIFLQGLWSQPFLPFRRAFSAWAGILMRFSPGSILTLEKIWNKIPRFSMYFAYFPGKRKSFRKAGRKNKAPNHGRSKSAPAERRKEVSDSPGSGIV
jgi:hypothetical protein